MEEVRESKKKFLLPLPYAFSIRLKISFLFFFFYFFLWNESLSLKSFRSMFFRDNFLYANCRKMYENISTLLVIQNIEIRNKIFNERWEWKLKLYNYFLTFNEYFFFFLKISIEFESRDFYSCKKKKNNVWLRNSAQYFLHKSSKTKYYLSHKRKASSLTSYLVFISRRRS